MAGQRRPGGSGRSAQVRFEYDHEHRRCATEHDWQLALEEYQASCSLSPVMASYLANDKDCQWLYHTKEFGDAQSSATP